MAPTASSRSPDVLWSSDRNAATKALAGVALGYRDTLVNLLCRDFNETASSFSEECNALIRSDVRYTLGSSDQIGLPRSGYVTKPRVGAFGGYRGEDRTRQSTQRGCTITIMPNESREKLNCRNLFEVGFLWPGFPG